MSVVALPVVVALAIDAAAQAGLGNQRFLQLAALPQRQFVLEDVDLLGQLRGHGPHQPFSPQTIACLHVKFPRQHRIPPAE